MLGGAVPRDGNYLEALCATRLLATTQKSGQGRLSSFKVADLPDEEAVPVYDRDIADRIIVTSRKVIKRKQRFAAAAMTELWPPPRRKAATQRPLFGSSRVKAPVRFRLAGAPTPSYRRGGCYL